MKTQPQKQQSDRRRALAWFAGLLALSLVPACKTTSQNQGGSQRY